ncbi:probable G-protein coupled receptor CG31760 [Pollicipes pollicipes]|uniref:probable G-protein coupled receptor CG31760 n=1 Tax=Pollicipes pollicipes TaxID=41117 RepID=UPI0018855376|nr:probable G-protein coupled receptor CG31760 [Pollicipes pollicipes]
MAPLRRAPRRHCFSQNGRRALYVLRRGTSGIDIDLRRVDIDQCPQRRNSTDVNIFAGSDKCKERTTKCVSVPGLGFRRGSYKCACLDGFYFPEPGPLRFYNGSVIEDEYEKKLQGLPSRYDELDMFECLPCAEGCATCEDGRPCLLTLNWAMRTSILSLAAVIIGILPFFVFFTVKYGEIKVVRAASPTLLRIIILGAFFIYSTTIVTYPEPNVATCTIRCWLREIGFSLSYGALMLKTWRISVIFRVRSAKAVKITDLDLLKRLGVLVAGFTALLGVRSLVAPPSVVMALSADGLKTRLCHTDWWDHAFSASNFCSFVWGIRLCIVVRKAPSEFNESKFISLTIYNEFLLTILLNISTLFLKSPANPDLLYIIFFLHNQLTITVLLVLIFGSKVYMVMKGQGRSEGATNSTLKASSAKFLSSKNSEQLGSNPTPTVAGTAGTIDFFKLTDGNVQNEMDKLTRYLEYLVTRGRPLGDPAAVAQLEAMLAAGRGHAAHVDRALQDGLGMVAPPSVDSMLTRVTGCLVTAVVGECAEPAGVREAQVQTCAVGRRCKRHSATQTVRTMACA